MTTAQHAIKAAQSWKSWGRWATIQYLRKRGIPLRLWYLARMLESAKKYKMNNTAEEYAAGFSDGHRHKVNDSMHRENLIKCRRGQLGDSPLVAAYWRGYGAALDARKIPTLAGYRATSLKP